MSFIKDAQYRNYEEVQRVENERERLQQTSHTDFIPSR